MFGARAIAARLRLEDYSPGATRTFILEMPRDIIFHLSWGKESVRLRYKGLSVSSIPSHTELGLHALTAVNRAIKAARASSGSAAKRRF